MGLIVCPSRELARQTHEVVTGYINSLKKDGYPQLRALLAMGGIDMREQVRLCDENPLPAAVPVMLVLDSGYVVLAISCRMSARQTWTEDSVTCIPRQPIVPGAGVYMEGARRGVHVSMATLRQLT